MGSSIVDDHPIEAFQRLRSGDFRIEYKLDSEYASLRDLYLRVTKSQRQVGYAHFSNDEHDAYCQNVDVIPEYRLKGIASAMYMFVEIIFDKRITNFWKSDPAQTEDARLFWESYEESRVRHNKGRRQR